MVASAQTFLWRLTEGLSKVRQQSGVRGEHCRASLPKHTGLSFLTLSQEMRFQEGPLSLSLSLSLLIYLSLSLSLSLCVCVSVCKCVHGLCSIGIKGAPCGYVCKVCFSIKLFRIQILFHFDTAASITLRSNQISAIPGVLVFPSSMPVARLSISSARFLWNSVGTMLPRETALSMFRSICLR